MRLALIACVISMTAVAGAQTVTKGAGASPTAHQTPAPPRPAPAPPPAAPRTTPPPIVFPLPPVAPPPAGGLTAPVRFTPPLAAGTPPVDMFRTGRRNPYRTHFYAPGVAGIRGRGGITDVSDPQLLSRQRAAAPEPSAVGLRHQARAGARRALALHQDDGVHDYEPCLRRWRRHPAHVHVRRRQHTAAARMEGS